jgi:hypothetical protein
MSWMQLNGYIIGIDLVPRPLGDPTEKRKQKMPVGKAEMLFDVSRNGRLGSLIEHD